MYLSVKEWEVVIQKFLRNLSISRGAKRAGISRNQYLRAVTEIRKAITDSFIYQMESWIYNPIRENVWLLKVRRERANGKQLIVKRTCIPQMTDEGLVYEGGLAFGLLSQRQSLQYLSDKNEANWNIELFNNNACSLWANIDEFVSDEDYEDADRYLYTNKSYEERRDGFIFDCEEECKVELVYLKKYFKIHLSLQRIGSSKNPRYFLAEALWKFQNRGLSRSEKINRILELMAQNNSA